MENLWPKDLKAAGTKAPVTILREQASLLGETTQNIIQAKVQRVELPEQHPGSYYETQIAGDYDLQTVLPKLPKKHLGLKENKIQMDFGYSFYIVAPALGNYRYKLFMVRHDIDLYPVNIYPDDDIMKEVCTVLPEQNVWVIQGNEATLVAKSEAEFIEILKLIFRSKRTASIIQALIAQSTDYSSK